MDTAKFEEMLRSPEKTQENLEAMLRNAERAKKPDLMQLAANVLNERFPGWDNRYRKVSGPTPVKASFEGEEQTFPTAKAGYVWLMDRMSAAIPDMFEKLDWKIEFLVRGTKRLYLAPELQHIFFGSPHLAEDKSNYERLSNGWFLNLNLNNDQKADILHRMGVLAGLEVQRDWSWQIVGANPSSLTIDELLRERSDDA